jgi:hypothetical protein
MTKVEIRYTLAHAPVEVLHAAVERLQSVYGLRTVRIAPGMDAVTVVFDASRLHASDIDAALRRAGLPVARS